jgi:ParB family chromosome partitioning protein
VREIPVAAIRANPYQPRVVFDPEGLAELADSIRIHGLLQPIVVRQAETGYEVVAGERRLRAAQALGLERVPVVVRNASDQDMQTLALVENLQREDLNAMEKARALRAMMRNFSITQEDAATRVGKARTTIANLLRLLELPPEIQELVESGRLSGAHARAVLQAQGTDRRLALARIAVEEGLSVREVERRARAGPTIGKRKRPAPDPYVKDLEDRLRRTLGADVRVEIRGKGGRIEVRYHDADDLDRLLDLLGA